MSREIRLSVWLNDEDVKLLEAIARDRNADPTWNEYTKWTRGKILSAWAQMQINKRLETEKSERAAARSESDQRRGEGSGKASSDQAGCSNSAAQSLVPV